MSTILALLWACTGSTPLPPSTPDPGSADAGPDQVAPVGQALVFDGSGSDHTGEPTWDFGDGTIASGLIVEHTYDAPGNYVAVLSIAGDGGLRRSDTARATIYRPAATPAPVVSGAITYDPTRRELWVAEPDADLVAVVHLDDTTVTPVPLCAHPRQVAFNEGSVGVTCERGDRMEILDAATRAITKSWPLGRGVRPFGVVGRGARWWVTGQGRGEVVLIDGNQADRVFPGPDARALAVVGEDRWLATRWRSHPDEGRVFASTGTIALAHDPGPDSDTQNRGVPTVLGHVAVSPDGHTAWVGGQVANIERGLWRDGDPLTFQTSVRATLRVIDLDAGLERLDERKVFDNQGEVTAVAVSPLGTWLWVAHGSTSTIQLLDAFSLQTAGAMLDVGAGIDGLYVTPDGGTLIVHAALDRELQAWDIADPTDPLLRWTVSTIDEEPLDAVVLQGKRLFNDAADPRLARDGYLACATCHPEGRSDGQTWDFTNRGEGLRNTISLEGHGGTRTGRLHWTGNFDEVQDFEGDIRAHQGGRGLLSDSDWAATQNPLGAYKGLRSLELDALATYVESLTTYPVSPWTAAPDGEALFYSFACDTCHVPETDFTDSSLDDPVRHDVGTALASSGTRLGQPLDGFDTPTLRGVFSTGPYLHDGRAPTVEAAIGAHVLNGPEPEQAELIAIGSWVKTL